MTTPRDDIAGLSERLRENADMASGGATYVCGPMREAATQLESLLKERDALQARVKELEADHALLTDPIAVHINMMRGTIAKPSWGNIRHLYPRIYDLEAAEARALRAEQERDEAYERAAKVAETYHRKVVGRDMKEATFDPAGRWEGGAIYDAQTVQSGIAAAIRRLAPGPEKEG